MNQTLEIRDVIKMLKTGKWLIIVCTVLAILCAGVLSWFVIEEKYVSKAIVQVSGGAQDTGVMSNYVATEFTPLVYIQRIQNEVVMNEAFSKADYTYYDKNNLTTFNQTNTNIIELTYKGSSSLEAQQHLTLLLDETKNQMDISVKETLIQLEKTYLNESNSLSKEIEQLMKRYNDIIISNKLPEVLILQTIASPQFVLNLTVDQSTALASISGAMQNELLQLKAQIDTKATEYSKVLTNYESVKTGIDSFTPDPFIRVINEPTLSENPSSPNKIINLAIGLIVGLMIGLGLVITRFNFNSTTRN